MSFLPDSLLVKKSVPYGFLLVDESRQLRLPFRPSEVGEQLQYERIIVNSVDLKCRLDGEFILPLILRGLHIFDLASGMSF